jgi:hypothetical protein
MKQFRISFLVVALSLMLTGAAFAVDIPNISTWTQSMGVAPGRGDVLLAALYDVKPLNDVRLPGAAGTTVQAQFTMFCIANTDRDYGNVVRIRFREWKRSRECLDFDIPLTTNDVWCGEVSRKPNGGAVLNTPMNGGERWVDTDRVVTASTAFPSGYFTGAPFPPQGLDFSTYDIESDETDKPGRCERGYIEFIGEERVGAPTTTAEPWRFPRVGISTAPADDPPRGRDVQDVLMGSVYLIRPTQAISHQYAMTALSDFSIDPNGIWDLTSSAKPNLYENVQGGPGQAGINPGIGGFEQLEAILARRLIYFQYVTGTDPGDQGQTPTTTSLVVTFPTKQFHYAKTTAHEAGRTFTAPTPALSGAPFTGLRETLNDHLFTDATHTAIAACSVGENVLFKIYDRNEHTFAPGAPISPAPTIPPGKLPWEVNIIGLYPSETMTPEFRNNVAVSTAGGGQTFYTGYGILDLGDNNQGKDNVTFNFFGNMFASYNGLPAIGIVMTEFYNGQVNGYYGNTIPFRYRTDWLTSATATNLIDLETSPGEHSWL